MTISKYRQEKIDDKKRKAIALYKSGLTFREVSKALKVSHEWARQAYLSTQSTKKV